MLREIDLPSGNSIAIIMIIQYWQKINQTADKQTDETKQI